MTNVKPSELNYDRYAASKYDRDIVNSIPFHKELHERIAIFVKAKFDASKEYHVLDLGTGTGITAKIIQDLLPKTKIDAVDFSKKMIAGAKKRLGAKNVRYLLGDYADMAFDRQYDIVVSVIGIHHQDDLGKQKLFKKIYSLLKPAGVFIFGDLVTYKNERVAALNNAWHYQHLAQKATDKETLAEWAYHHMFLNDLAPIEKQIAWLKGVGFQVKKDFLEMNTALLFCLKNKKRPKA